MAVGGRFVVLRVVCWNIARRREAWRCLLGMDADVALLQEAAEPPPGVAERFDVSPGLWCTGGADVDQPRLWRTAVVKLSDRVDGDWIEAKPIAEAGPGELAVSRAGTLAAATVTPPGGEPLVVVSMYAPWTRPHSSTATARTAAATGLPATKPCSRGWRRSVCFSLTRRPPTGGRQTLGPASCPATAGMSPPTTPTSRIRPRRPASSTSCSPQDRSPRPCACGPSTSQSSGAPLPSHHRHRINSGQPQGNPSPAFGF